VNLFSPSSLIPKTNSFFPVPSLGISLFGMLILS
jgi:hypothetical protein